ncbi:iron complex transport system ATP-binding protein [Herbihabitans rhizosphaerae]|uniref:Iron complex transport system ATP-binding protein n=1 Tax=Herbihabitans rhizosphaerae TaxID=1872711 RepID=A0A4Q7L2Q8_9PSEU|nr:iron complex transport system ATP-binding protein [Herbihabitans rhizosphaerae]
MIVHDVDLDVRPHETVGLIGPNGSGKSTLLRCVAGLRAPSTGVVRYDGEDISGWSRRQVARRIAFVEQVSHADSDLRLIDVVGLGRTPFRDPWRGPTVIDRLVIEAAVERLGLTGLEERQWSTLSGGERQRAHIARALAQQPYGILLDEPTNHLDVRHQFELMELLAGSEATVIVALHDLSLAARYCDRLVLLDGGTPVAAGTPDEVLSRDRLRSVFEMDAELGTDALGNPAVVYRSPISAAGRPTARRTAT